MTIQTPPSSETSSSSPLGFPSIMQIPLSTLHRILALVDLTTLHSVLLTSRLFFTEAAPFLYVSPFSALLNHPKDSWSYRNRIERMAQLVQVLIACTIIQPRLPALSQLRYGGSWVRSPTQLNYLYYFRDQSQVSTLMVQCFHLLFEDLIPKTNKSSIPKDPTPEAFRVRDQIQKSFIQHSAIYLTTLNISAQMIGEIVWMVPQFNSLHSLELGHIHRPFDLSTIVDFVKSHRMTFGKMLTSIQLGDEFSMGKKTFADLVPVLKAVKDLEVLKAGYWTEALSSLYQIPTFGLQILQFPVGPVLWTCNTTIPGSSSSTASSPSSSSFVSRTSLLLTSPSPTTTLNGTNGGGGSGGGGGGGEAAYMTTDLSTFLQKCRNLKQLSAPVGSPTLFRWAVLERKSRMISSPIMIMNGGKLLDDNVPNGGLHHSASNNNTNNTNNNNTNDNHNTQHHVRTHRHSMSASSSHSMRTTTISPSGTVTIIPRFESLSLHGLAENVVGCLGDGTFAFQESLTTLEGFSTQSVHHLPWLSWNWPLKRLTKIRLEGPATMVFKLESLKWCPNLQELSLKNSIFFDPTLEPIELTGTEGTSTISKLKYLKVLTMTGGWRLTDRTLRRIARRCFGLNRLELNGTVGHTVGGLMLAVEEMKSLTVLELRLNLNDLKLMRVVAGKKAGLIKVALSEPM